MKKWLKWISCLCMLALLGAPTVSSLAEAAEADYAITLTADTTDLIAGQKAVITAAFANPDTVNQKARNNGIQWSVTDENGEATKLASVNNNGQVNTQKNIPEKTVFVVTAASKSMPEQQASIRISVTPAAAAVNISAGRDMIYTNEGWNTLQLSASVEPADAGQQVVWASSAPKVMTVDENGLVTALAPGRATITATAEDGSRKAGRINLQAGEAAERIDLSVPTDLLKAGGSMNFSYSFHYEMTARLFNEHPEKIWATAKPINKDVEWTLTVDRPEAEPYITFKNGKLTVAKDCPICAVKVTVTALGSLPGKEVSSSALRFVKPAVSGSPVDQAELKDFYGVWRIAELIDDAGKSFGPSQKLMLEANQPEELYWFEVGYYYQRNPDGELCMANGLDNGIYPVTPDGGALLGGSGTALLSMRDDGTVTTSCYVGSAHYQAVLYRVEEDFHTLTLRGKTEYEHDESGRQIRSTDYYVFGDIMAVTDFTYDDSGRLTEEVTRDADGNETKKTVKEYNEAGLRTLETRYIRGSLDWKQEYQYDEKGNCIRENHYNKDGTLAGFDTTEYDEAGREVKMEQHSADGYVYTWRTEEYNDHGDLIRHLWYGPDNQVDYSMECMYFEYDYDENGKITEKRVYYYHPDGSMYLARTDHPDRD